MSFGGKEEVVFQTHLLLLWNRTPEDDTVCMNCPQGTFSHVASTTEPCVPHRDCSQMGMKTRIPGTATHDAVCERELAIDCTRKHTDCHAGLLQNPTAETSV
ncbi:tumor necrosis factor receptor superfamily member 11B-like [Tachysurus ichikawai]